MQEKSFFVHKNITCTADLRTTLELVMQTTETHHWSHQQHHCQGSNLHQHPCHPLTRPTALPAAKKKLLDLSFLRGQLNIPLVADRSNHHRVVMYNKVATEGLDASSLKMAQAAVTVPPKRTRTIRHSETQKVTNYSAILQLAPAQPGGG